MSTLRTNDQNTRDVATAGSPRVLRMPEVCKKVGLGPDAVYKGVREKWFPAPFPLTPSGRAMGWYEHEVDAYLARRAGNREVTP